MSEAIPNATQYDLISATVFTSSGNTIDIKFIIEDLNIFQDIFASCISGELKVRDSQNIFGNYAFCGNEYLHIKFQTLDYKPFDKYFRIYKISDAKFRNATSFEYIISFCSEEFILNQQIRISKSYNGIKSSDIVNDIVSNFLKVDPTRFSYNQTTINQKIIIPNEKPFEAINWVSSFSLDTTLTSAFTFFESTSGFKFKSMNSLVTATPYNKYLIYPQNLVSDQYNRLQNKFIINNIEINQMFDVLSTLSNGGYSSKMVKFDITHGKSEILNFNPVNNSFNKLNDHIPFNDAINRHNNSLISNSSYVRYFTNFQGNLVDKWLLQRASQFALLNNNRISISIYGDSQIEVGMVVNIDFPNIVPLNTSDEVSQDKYKSGNYLVTSVKHKIFENRFMTYLELCKDSNIAPFPTAQSSKSYDTAKKL